VSPCPREAMRFTPPLAISAAEIDEAMLRFLSPLGEESETIPV